MVPLRHRPGKTNTRTPDSSGGASPRDVRSSAPRPTPGHHCGCSAPTTGVGRVGSYPVLASATCSATTEDSARVRSPRTPRAVGDHARYRPTSLPPGCSRSSSDRTEPRSTTRTPAPHQHQSQLLITNHLPPHTPQPPTRRPPLITAEPPHPGAASAPVPTPHHQPPPSTHTSATDQAATWGARSVTLLARSLTATGEPICGSLRTPVCAPRTISILCDPVPFAAASSQGGTCTVQ